MPSDMLLVHHIFNKKDCYVIEVSIFCTFLIGYVLFAMGWHENDCIARLRIIGMHENGHIACPLSQYGVYGTRDLVLLSNAVYICLLNVPCE